MFCFVCGPLPRFWSGEAKEAIIGAAECDLEYGLDFVVIWPNVARVVEKVPGGNG